MENIKEIIIENNNTIRPHNQLSNSLIKFIDEYSDKINIIETNSNIASVLQDCSLYSLQPLNDKIYNYSYHVGIFHNIPLMVNSILQWGDKIIYLKKDSEIMLKISVIDVDDLLV